MSLIAHAVRFGRELRGAGLGVTRVQVTQFVQALTCIDLSDRELFRDAARATLVSRRDELDAFERVFARFWRQGPPPPSTPAAERTRIDAPDRRVRGAAQIGVAPSRPRPRGPAGAEPPRQAFDRAHTFSAAEILRHTRFDELSEDELAAVERSMQRFAWRMSDRLTRRYRRRPRGRQLDWRRTLAAATRHEGEWIVRRWSARVRRPRPLVVIADVSGSMERYARVLLTFFHALTQQGARHGRRQRVETFVFGTRLTRVTPALARRDVNAALAGVGRRVVDWAGGTRIGESLQTFNRLWARRVLGRGAVAIVVSDGWDRGDPDLIAREMARLARLSSRLVWLNPLIGTRGFAPRTRGLAAALPHVDDFLPVDDLASLEALARHLERLPSRARPVGGRASVPATTD